MSASTFARLREQTMVSLEEEEAVTVNTRALIDKVLARYSGEWTTLRELIQNAADAQAKKVTIRFETVPSASVPVPSTQDTSARLRHVLHNHTLKTLLVSNDGEAFKETDWQRLKRIAEGNPDETKIGAFGVGFYSVFADCETPFVSSGQQTMAFYWKKDSLFTRRGKSTNDGAGQDTTFLLDYRNQTTPIPQLLGLCQFLATSLTFVELESIELFLDDWRICSLLKKMAPAASVSIPKDVNSKTRDGLMQIIDVQYQSAQIDAEWMNVAAWNRMTAATSAASVASAQVDGSAGGSLRSWFSRLTTASNGSSVTAKRLQREEETVQQAIADDLPAYSRATVFLRLSTVNVQTNISRQLSAELERATKKPPPKKTKIAILTSSYDETAASISATSGTASKKASDIFASVLPTKNGRIFIGFPTGQTTGLLAHISAPSVIPTVERESIDLNARYVRDWNVELLRVAGIACRIAYAGEMADLRSKLERMTHTIPKNSITKENLDTIMPAAIHAYKQYNFEESTPSARVAQCIEEGFWTCNQKDSIEILSTRGILPSQKVRVATEQLSFVDGIPVVPDELMDKVNTFFTKLREFDLLSDITITDIKRELEAQALNENQVIELIRWACGKVSRNELGVEAVASLFDGTVASISEEHAKYANSPVLQMGQINTYVNTARFPPDVPVPSQTIPFRFTKGVPLAQLSLLGWEELQIVPWVRWIVETDGRPFGADQSFTKTPTVAIQALPIISKAWDGLSQTNKQSIVELLSPRTIIPTKMGMQKPTQSYFSNVRLFDDLPTITGLQGVKEKFLSALGVRKTVELSVVFDRLMDKSASTSKETTRWGHVDLIKYLLTVKDDIPKEDLQRLRNTPICTAESHSGDATAEAKLYRIQDLFEPIEAVRKLRLPILQWPPPWRSNSQEGHFLKNLGLKSYPSVPDLVGILSAAPPRSELQQQAISYFIVNHFQNGYNKFDMSTITTAFLPVIPFAGEADNLIARADQCFANPQAAVLRFRTLRADLQPHHSMFGVAYDPTINAAADRLIKTPPLDPTSAKLLFGYFSGRLKDIVPNSALAEKLGNAPIVPTFKHGEKQSPAVRFVSPKSCFLGDDQTYGDIFDFVDFGPEANSFLLRVGSKHEPSAVELASMLVQQPARLLDSLGIEKYQHLLGKIAAQATVLKKDRTLWTKLRSARSLLGFKLSSKSNSSAADGLIDIDEDGAAVKDFQLAVPSELVIADDFTSYQLFQTVLLTAPLEIQLEEFYAALGTPLLSQMVEESAHKGSVLNDQSSAAKLQKLLAERARLFLHDHAIDAIKHDSRWLEQNLIVQTIEFLQQTRTLRMYNKKFTEKKSALLHRPSKKDATLYITQTYDLYEVSRAVTNLLLKKPRQQDILAFETILASDLRGLKMKGYNVDRILRQQAAELRIAESERQKRVEEQQRLLTEAQPTEKAPTTHHDSLKLPQTNSRAERPPTPDKSLSMPGAFSHSPEQAALPQRNKKTGLFDNIRQQLGLSTHDDHRQSSHNLLTNEPAGGVPPPYTARDPNVNQNLDPDSERVSSPRALQQNLQSAIKASRVHNSSTLFSPPETNQIKETPSYCDKRPSQDLVAVADLSSGVKLFLSRKHPNPTTFLQSHGDEIASFVWLLSECSKLFDLSAKTVNVFHDESGASIAFNSSGSIFCNLRYFMQLHAGQMSTAEGKIEAMSYWFITLCHELAHNLVGDHSAAHSFYTESFASNYFRRVLWWSNHQTRMTTRGHAVPGIGTAF